MHDRSIRYAPTLRRGRTHRGRDRPNPAIGDVVARLAHLGRNDAPAHQPMKDDASKTHSEHRLECGRGGDRSDEDNRQCATSRIPCDASADGKRGTNSLSEALRRPGHEPTISTKKLAQSGRDDARCHLPERTQCRPGGYPSDKAVRQRNEQPPLPEYEERNALRNDTGSDQSGRGLVHRIWESKQVAHTKERRRRFPTKQLGNCCDRRSRDHGTTV